MELLLARKKQYKIKIGRDVLIIKYNISFNGEDIGGKFAYGKDYKIYDYGVRVNRKFKKIDIYIDGEKVF